jgi:hypothetical protein
MKQSSGKEIEIMQEEIMVQHSVSRPSVGAGVESPGEIFNK